MGQKPSEFLLALQFPSDMMSSFMELDGLFDKMLSQYSKEKAKRQAEEEKANPHAPRR